MLLCHFLICLPKLDILHLNLSNITSSHVHACVCGCKFTVCSACLHIVKPSCGSCVNYTDKKLDK